MRISELTVDHLVHHIRVNGKPYCQEESINFEAAKRYPTNCSHSNKASAEEGVAECKKKRPDLTYEVVLGDCHTDPFWQTEEGRAAIQLDDELQEMRWS